MCVNIRFEMFDSLEGSEGPATSKTSSSRGACAAAPPRPAAAPAAIARASVVLLSIVCGFCFRLALRFQHVEPALLLQHLLVQRVVHGVARLSLQWIVKMVRGECQVTFCRTERVLSTQQKQLEHLYDSIAQAGAQLAWDRPNRPKLHVWKHVGGSRMMQYCTSAGDRATVDLRTSTRAALPS
jgi:hypothetical protein